ncbi:IS982 family transposase, partial [Bacillus thuringiensis]|nr:IS982 family transposase [Bacillus thuringiensis]
DTLLGKRRKKIETVFSSLERLGIQDFRSRSILGFESRLESI